MKNVIFPSEFPHDFLENEKRYLNLHEKIEKIWSMTQRFYFPVEFAKKTLEETSELKKKITSSKTKSEIIEILNLNMKERLESFELSLNRVFEKDFDYEINLKMNGLSGKDISKKEKELKSLNIQKKIQELTPLTESVFERQAHSEEEFETIKSFIVELLNVAFQKSPNSIKVLFDNNFHNYLITVEFLKIPNARSYHLSGRVYFNLMNAIVSELTRGHKVETLLNLPQIADLVGEESLLGHQGHFLITERAQVPEFLRRPTRSSTRINVETIAHLGKDILVSELENNPEVRKKLVSEDNFRILMKGFELFELSRKVRTFASVYGDYLKFVKNLSDSQIGKKLFEISKDPFYLSDYFLKRFNYYSIKDFWEDPYSKIDTWVYVMTDTLSAKIENTFGKLSGTSMGNILNFLNMGYWTRTSFEEYFKFLVKEFS